MAADEVFVSYKSERRPAAEHFAEVLRYHGFPSWFDYKLVVGKDFRDQLNEKAHAARALVVLWCRRSVKSEWVQIEADIGLKQGTLVPVLIEDCELPERFRHLQCVDMRRWDANPRSGEALDRLLDAIAAKLGREPVKDDKALRSLEEKWRRFGSPPLSKFTLEDPLEGPSQVPPAKPPMVARQGTSRPGRTPLVAGLLTGVAVAAIAVAYLVGPRFVDPTISAIAAETDRSRLIDIAKSSGRWDDVAKRLAALEYVCIRRNQAPLSDCQWRKPGDGEPFKEIAGCIYCPEMVVVPPSKSGARPFAVARFELTIREWNEALSERTWPSLNSTHRGARGDTKLPHTVTYEEAQQFAKWISETTRATYRLPHDDEWLHVARGGRTGQAARYPTGDFVFPEYATYTASVPGRTRTMVAPGGPTAVGTHASRKPHEWNVADMAGNLWEWTQHCSTRSSANASTSCAPRVRGGAWNSTEDLLDTDLDAEKIQRIMDSKPPTGLRLVREIPD